MAAVWRILGMRRRRPTTALPIHVRRRRTAWNSVGSGGRALPPTFPSYFRRYSGTTVFRSCPRRPRGGAKNPSRMRKPRKPKQASR
jgi:hypothetical protein